MKTRIVATWVWIVAVFVLATGFLLAFHSDALSTYFWDEDDLVYVSMAYGSNLPDYIFSNESLVQYFPRPTTHLYCWLIASLAGNTVWPYFLSNILLLSGSTALLFFLSRKLFGSISAGLLIGFFFLLSPCATDNVYWFAAGATGYLSSFLILFALTLYHKARSGTKNKNKFLAMAGAYVAAILAMGAKEAAVSLPLLLTLIELNGDLPVKDRLKNLLPFYGLAAAYGLYVILVQISFPEDGNFNKYGLDWIILRNLLHSFTYPLVGVLPPMAGEYNVLKLIVYPILWISPLIFGSKKTRSIVLFGLVWILLSSLPYLPWKVGLTGFFPKVCDIQSRYFDLPSAGAAIVMFGFFRMLLKMIRKEIVFTLAVIFAVTISLSGVELIKEKAEPMLIRSETRLRLLNVLRTSWNGTNLFYVGYFGFQQSTIDAYNRLYFNGNLIMLDGIPQGVPEGTRMLTGPVSTPVLLEFNGHNWLVKHRYESCIAPALSQESRQ